MFKITLTLPVSTLTGQKQAIGWGICLCLGRSRCVSKKIQTHASSYCKDYIVPLTVNQVMVECPSHQEGEWNILAVLASSCLIFYEEMMVSIILCGNDGQYNGAVYKFGIN